MVKVGEEQLCRKLWQHVEQSRTLISHNMLPQLNTGGNKRNNAFQLAICNLQHCCMAAKRAQRLLDSRAKLA